MTRHSDEALATHPTVKPVRMVADAILDCSRRGDRVLDGFTGSGTALLAADLKKRMMHKTIAKKRVLSEEMVTYRIRVTGVARQIASGKRRRSV